MQLITSIPGWNLLIPLVSIAIFATIHLRGDRDRDRARSYEIVLLYSIGIIGFNGIVGFFVHTIWADAAAESIGWAAGSPFQQEVAGANLGIGVVGFLGFWRRDFWLPYLIARTLFSSTAGIVHLADLAANGNLAPNNAGLILAWDLVVPVVLCGLYALMRRARGPERDRLWGRHVAELPWFAPYPEKSGRVIPMIRLSRQVGGSDDLVRIHDSREAST
jgi:hypothetical protein